MTDYGRPVRVFLMNLLAWGFRLWVEDGTLHVRKPEGMDMPPALAEEIRNRARFLVEILAPFPQPMQRWYGRLLDTEEKREASLEAARHGYTWTATPANGKWFIEVRE